MNDPVFAASTQRPLVWKGFLGYVQAWDLAEHQLGQKIVLSWWIAGSFISGNLAPADIDLTPVLDRGSLDMLKGQPGIGRVKKLLGDRNAVRKFFHVEPFPLYWSSEACTLFPQKLPFVSQGCLMNRGGLDAFWQRLRPPGAKCPPVAPTQFAERGYVEVLR